LLGDGSAEVGSAAAGGGDPKKLVLLVVGIVATLAVSTLITKRARDEFQRLSSEPEGGVTAPAVDPVENPRAV